MAFQCESGVGKLFVRNLDKTIDKKALHDTFSPYGNILHCKVVQDKGYGFVDFATAEAANKAIEKVNGMMWNGKKVFVKRSVSRQERESDFGKVFVRNLTETVDNKALYDMLSPYGNILSHNVVLDEAGQCKGFGFVRFDTKEAADMAVKEGTGLRNGRFMEIKHSIHDPLQRMIQSHKEEVESYREFVLSGEELHLLKKK